MKTNKQKLIKKLDTLASQIVRERDGQCLICGCKENLQAHHFIITKGRSTKHRWNLKNLITLCYACHIFKVHSTACLQIMDVVRKSAIENKICTESDINEIETDISVAKFSISDLQEKVEELEKIKKEIL